MRVFKKLIQKNKFKNFATRVDKTSKPKYEPTPEDMKEKVKEREVISISKLHENLKNFNKKIENEVRQEDTFVLFRSFVTYYDWLVPTMEKPLNNEELKVVTVVSEEENKKRLILFSNEETWAKDKVGNHLVPLEDISYAINDDVDEILIDPNTEHSFLISKNFFDTVVSWRKILNLEEALHRIRISSDMARLYQEMGKQFSDEVLRDFVYVPMDYVKRHGEFIVIADTSSSDNNVKLLMAPKKFDKKLVALFTAPDTAFQFTELNHIKLDSIRTIKADELFGQLLELGDDIDGVNINCATKAVENLNSELILSKHFLNVIMSKEGQN